MKIASGGRIPIRSYFLWGEVWRRLDGIPVGSTIRK